MIAFRTQVYFLGKEGTRSEGGNGERGRGERKRREGEGRKLGKGKGEKG